METWITSDGRAYFVQLYENKDVSASTSDASITEERLSEVWSHFAA